jgi:hypothetical protein
MATGHRKRRFVTGATSGARSPAITASTVAARSTSSRIDCIAAGDVSDSPPLSGQGGATLLLHDHPFLLAMLAALLVAALCGVFNGTLVARFGVQPIIATPILFIVGRGITQLIRQHAGGWIDEHGARPSRALVCRPVRSIRNHSPIACTGARWDAHRSIWADGELPPPGRPCSAR